MICLEAPEAAEVPRSLLRADGRSVYQRHGGVRYAIRTQLAMEERLVAQAAVEAAPHLTRAGAERNLDAGSEWEYHVTGDSEWYGWGIPLGRRDHDHPLLGKVLVEQRNGKKVQVLQNSACRTKGARPDLTPIFGVRTRK